MNGNILLTFCAGGEISGTGSELKSDQYIENEETGDEEGVYNTDCG